VSVGDRWAKGYEPRFDIDSKLGPAGEKKVASLIEEIDRCRRKARR
jgi:hypothetical protein